jgi:D-glycero-D-manno-heptose 1,7-bisphosphate phosphatase
MLTRAAFIDRDGVINEDRAYVHRIADFKLIPGAVEALRALREAGYLLVVITNQSGIARGMFSEADYQVLEAHMRERLAEGGVTLDSVQYCPHLPDAEIARYRCECECRKPRAGMLRNAAAALTAAAAVTIDFAESILIGDRRSDLDAGRAAGVGRCFLVRSGQTLSDGDERAADGTFADLAQCVAELLKSAD